MVHERTKRDLAWVGDAVLGLYVREWLLQQPESPPFTRQERFIKFTSNAFLAGSGEPTDVEARIGDIYNQHGLQAAFVHIEAELLPRYKVHIDKAARALRGTKAIKRTKGKRS
jgi:selenocysteine lyase/cysteine desulfurase